MKTLLLGTIAALSLFGASAATAQDAGTWSFNVGATSDYVFRGISQTDNNPAIQGGIDYSNGMFYAGTWASNVNFAGDEDTTYEVDVYAGVKPKFGNFNMDFGAAYYAYPNQIKNGNYNFWEFKALASHPVGPGTIGGAFVYSPEWFGKTGRAYYYELNGSVPVSESLSLSAAIGHQDFDKAKDYNTWNLGLNYMVNEKLSLDLRYHDTNVHKLGDIYESRVTAMIKATF